MSTSDGQRDQQNQTGVQATDAKAEVVAVNLDIPTAELGLDLASIIGSSAGTAEEENVKQRASNVLKLAEENEKLKAELKATTERLEAAERRRQELTTKEQKVMEEPSS